MVPGWIEKLTKRYSSLGVEFIWVIVAQLFMLMGGLLTIKLLSNLLSTQEFGIYALLFSIVSFLVSALYTPLGQINLRFLIVAQQQGMIEKFRSDIQKFWLLISALSLLILFPAAYFLSFYTGNWLLTFIGLALLTLFMGTQTTQQYLMMAFRLRQVSSVTQMIGAISRPLGALSILVLFGYFALSALFGLAFGFFVLLMAQLFFLKKPWKMAISENQAQKDKIQINSNHLSNKEYFSYGVVYWLIGLVTIVVLNADRWLLSYFGSLEQVAIYAVLMQVALAPVAFGFAILTRLAAPIYFSTKSEPKAVQDTQFKLLLTFWAFLCAVVLLVAGLFHYQLVQLLTNTSFAAYSYLLPWMVLGLMLERTAQIFELKGSMLLNTKIYVFPRLLSILLVPGLELLFLQFFGFDWLVIGLVCATAVSLFSIVLVNRSTVQKSLPPPQVVMNPVGKCSIAITTRWLARSPT